MNILTHILISKRAYIDLNNHFSVKLSLGSLIWGSVKPDLINSGISHCKDETSYLFYQKLEDIKKITLDKDKKKYSLKLGEIFHYLCDYFCYAHNNKELLKYFPHIRYEKNLHSTAKKIKFKLPYGYIDYGHFSFLELIERKHKLYLSRVASYENDIWSSYEILIFVTLKLLVEAGLIPIVEEEISCDNIS